MRSTVTEERVHATASEVHAVLADPYTYPRWLVGTKRIRRVSPEWPEPGSWFDHAVGFGPMVLPDRTTLRDIESPHLLTLLARARPALEAVVQFDVTPTGEWCTLRMTETPVGGFKHVARFVRPLVKLRNQRSLRHFKNVVETSRGHSRA